MAAAHVAATLAGGLEKEQKKLAAKTLKRASAYDSASTQIEQTCAKVTKLTEGLQELQENLDKMRSSRQAVMESPGKAKNRSSAANTPTRSGPPRKARPERGNLAVDPFCRPLEDRPKDLAPPEADREETYEDVAPKTNTAEHLPGDCEWRLFGPGKAQSPIIRKGSVLTITTQKYKALVIEVLLHNPGRIIPGSRVAPIVCVALYDVENVRVFGVDHDVPKAEKLADSMRINEVFQDDKWFGDPIKVEEIIAVGVSLYCDQYRLPEKDFLGCAELLRQGIWIVVGALRLHKLPEDSNCKRNLYCISHKPASDAIVVVSVQWAPEDRFGNVLTHPFETARYVGAPLPMPFVPTGQPPNAIYPGIMGHAQRVARWRMMVDACRISGSVMWAVRVQRHRMLNVLVLEWLEKTARSLQPDASGNETAGEHLLSNLVMADVNDLLVRHGLVDGVQGRCPGVSVCVCQRAASNDPTRAAHTLINLPACRRLFGVCRPDILPPSMGNGAGSSRAPNLGGAKLTCLQKEVDIPYRLMNSAAGRDAFGFPTKTAPAKGTYGRVWFACFCPLCPCAAGGFACRMAGTETCTDPSRCTCSVTIASKINPKTGAEELRIRGYVQGQGLGGALSAVDMPALGGNVSVPEATAWQHPGPPPAVTVPGTEDTFAGRAQVPETPTGQPPPPASTPSPRMMMGAGGGWGGCARDAFAP